MDKIKEYMTKQQMVILKGDIVGFYKMEKMLR